jgi:hypothetical protein
MYVDNYDIFAERRASRLQAVNRNGKSDNQYISSIHELPSMIEVNERNQVIQRILHRGFLGGIVYTSL